MHLHRLYGRIVASPFPLPAEVVTGGAPAITIRMLSGAPPDRSRASASLHDSYAYDRAADGSVRIAWDDRFFFHVSTDGSLVRAWTAHDTEAEALYSYLLSQVLSVALLQQGVEGLHAVALAWGDEAIAIIGDCGYGKSTLAAFAIASGAKLLTDDLLIGEQTDPAVILPGVARIKLAADSASATLGARPGTPMGDGRGKWIYPLNASEFAETPRRLARIYALQPDAERASVERLNGADAMRVLIAATFNPLDQTRARLEKHIRHHAALARAVPVYSLAVPRRMDVIPEVLNRVR